MTDRPVPLDLYLIKPTRYDADGYPLQWFRSLIPSNSLACVAALVEDDGQLARGLLVFLGFGNGRDELGLATIIHDLLGGLPLLVEFPVSARADVG